MCDLLKSRGDVIDAEKISGMLGVPVVEVSALHNENVDELVNKAIESGRGNAVAKGVKCFSPEVEDALAKIADVIGAPAELSRWYSIKVFERDVEAIAPLALSQDKLDAAEKIISQIEKDRDDDAESIITSERYDWIATVMDECVTKAPKQLTPSQKIDRVVTNRWLGLPIFACVMVLVYYIAISTVGTAATDWVNDNLFADGFFVNGASQAQYEEDTAAYDENHYGDVASGFLAAAQERGIVTKEVSKALAAEEPTDDDKALIEKAGVK
jgi:ferrous iron transport protein B